MNDSLKISGRIDKMINWLSESRNQWRNKSKEVKQKLKRQTLETKRAREGRALLKEKLKEANNRVLEIESCLKKQSHQLEELKKKSLLMKMK